MKKIFLVCLSAGFISTSFAQSSVADVPENKIKPAYEKATPTKPAATKVVAVEKPVPSSVIANAHNTPAPIATTAVTISVPKQQAEPVAPSRLVSMSATKDDLPVQVAQQPATTKPVPAKASSVQPDVPSPAIQMVPAGSLNNKVVPQNHAVPSTSSVEVRSEAVNKANPATVAIPVISLATSADASIAPVTSPVKVEQVQTKPAPVQLEEIKPSVNTPAPKAPQMPMQTEKPKGK